MYFTRRGHVKHAMYPVYKYLASLASKKVKGIKVRSNDVKSFVNAFVNALVINPEFESQTKKCSHQMKKILEANAIGQTINLKNLTKAECSKKSKHGLMPKLAKNYVQKLRLKASLISQSSTMQMAGRNETESKLCHIIFAEGDSALTSALSGFEIVGRKYWGPPLKGKLLNVRDASSKQLLDNSEVQNMCKILGLVPFQPPDASLMRYGRCYYGRPRPRWFPH